MLRYLYNIFEWWLYTNDIIFNNKPDTAAQLLSDNVR